MLEAKLTKLSYLGMAFVFGYLTALGNNHVKQLWSEHGQLQVIQKQVVPALKAEAKCEHKHAQINAKVAKEGIKGAIDDNAPIPSEDAIAKDDCLHK